ncbi:hypothetical protein GLGCALEP_04045 [Pseudomonas sp. MM221]|nr:hypothetical protein GLGCALEP_04045 [Pseudomonas sp. MM221]
MKSLESYGEYMGNHLSPLMLLAASLLSCATVQAQDATFSLDIPAQRLDRSLNALAQQTGTRILFSTDAAEGRQAAAVHGHMSVAQALQQLLAGSGLQLQRAGEGYLIGAPASGSTLGWALPTSTASVTATAPTAPVPTPWALLAPVQAWTCRRAKHRSRSAWSPASAWTTKA